MTQGRTASSVLKNAAGVTISPGEIFNIDFYPKSNPPKPPYIGPHFGVVTHVASPDHLLVVYSESECGNGPCKHIFPSDTVEAYPFQSVIKTGLHFRDDSVVLLHRSFIGTHVDRVIMSQTLPALIRLAEGAVRANTAINLKNVVRVTVPKAPPTPNPK